jgi:hypothetical protein
MLPTAACGNLTPAGGVHPAPATCAPGVIQNA